MIAKGCDVRSNSIGPERLISESDIIIPCRIPSKRFIPVSCIRDSCRIPEERLVTNSLIVRPCGIGEEGLISDSDKIRCCGGIERLIAKSDIPRNGGSCGYSGCLIPDSDIIIPRCIIGKGLLSESDISLTSRIPEEGLVSERGIV